jgi:GDP-L-fucose synthase
MNRTAKIYVTGHSGLAGSALLRALQSRGYENVITRTHQELDLLDQRATLEFFDRERPDFVLHAAAKSGGMWAAITESAQFIYENIMIQSNVIHAAHKHGTKKLLFVGSTSIFPRDCPQPIREEYLLTGALEPTNQSFAVAKIAGIIMCQSYNKQYGTNFISALATNLYGPNDNFDTSRTHVFATLIRKFHDAVRDHDRQVTLWGTGNPRREFLHADDFADACLFLMNNYDGQDIVNIGTGEDISICELAAKMKAVAKFEGAIHWDLSKPDGHPQKWLDVEKLRELGWRHSIGLDEGIRRTYEWYRSHVG